MEADAVGAMGEGGGSSEAIHRRLQQKGCHMDVLKYAHENGCSWNERTCTWAAMGGHLAVLKYAREHGCPWDRTECRDIANLCGHDQAVAWINAHP